MSADDFQSKYASVMESMLKSAIAETTKLFENMVDELKAEISKIKKENEDLKTRCFQYETAKSKQDAHTRESQSVTELSDASEKCDTAVQCDLVPCRTILVEECEPLIQTELERPDEQYRYEWNNYSLREHNYVSYRDRTSQMEVVVVKQESELKQEDDSDVACGQVMGPCGVSVGETSIGGLNMRNSSTEITLPPINKSPVVLQLPLSETDNSQVANNQSTEIRHSLVISLKDALRDDIKEETEMVEVAKRGVVTSGDKQMPPQASHMDSVTTQEPTLESASLIKQKSGEELKNKLLEGKTNSKPSTPTGRRRGRPPKKTRQRKALPSSTDKEVDVKTPPAGKESTVPSPPLVKETSSAISSSIKKRANNSLEGNNTEPFSGSFSSGEQPALELQQSGSEVEKNATVDETQNTPSGLPPQASSGLLKTCQTSVSLQDALLLVEAMNQSTIDDNILPPKVPLQSEIKSSSASCVSSLNTVAETPVVQQIAPFETQLRSIPTSPVPANLTAAGSSRDVNLQNPVVTLPKSCLPTPPSFSNSTKPMSSTATTRTVVRSSPLPIINMPVPTKGPRTIIILPRPSLTTDNAKAGPQTPHSAVNSTSNKISPPPSSAALLHETRALTSVPPKSIKVVYRKHDSPIPLQPSTVLNDHQYLAPQTITIVSKQILSGVSRKPEPIILAANKDNNELVASVPPESSKQLSELQESDPSYSEHATSENVDHRNDNLNPPGQTGSVIESQAPSQEFPADKVQPMVSSSLPRVSEQELSAVVRLTRLPLFVSTKESVLISTLISKGIIQGKQSSTVVSEETHANIFLQSPGPSTTDQPTPDLDQEVVSKGMEDKQEDATVTEKNASDPHGQMSKTQFLAKLYVSPLEIKTSVNESSKAQGAKSIVSRLRSHLQAHLEAKTSSKKQSTEVEMTTDRNLKRPRLNVKEPSQEPNQTLVSPANEVSCVQRSGLHKDGGEPDDVFRISRSTNESSCIDFKKPSSSRHGVSPKNMKSISVIRRQSSSPKESTSINMVKSTSVSPNRNPLNPKDTISRIKKSSPKGLTSISAKITANDFTPKGTKSVKLTPKKITKLSSSPEKTKISPGESSSSPAMPGTNSCSTSPKSTMKLMKRESGSFSFTRYSIAADGSIIETYSKSESPAPKSLKMRNDVSNSQIAGEPNPKKPRQLQGHPGQKTNNKIISARKLTNAAKGRRRAGKKRGSYKKKKMELPVQSGVLKKCRAKVWYPPTLPPNEKPMTEYNRPPPLKVEYRIPDIPLSAPPIVSPLQPLAVIGRHLLRNQCGECGRVFSNSNALESHVSLHKVYRPFSCKLCGKYFPDAKTFKRHDRVHRNGRIHLCPHCGRGFVYRFGLSKHIQMVHGRIKPFICQVCGKGFYTKRDVEIHIRIHTGEKPFQCHICERRFTRKVELNVHLRWHNGEKRHWCQYCGKGFLDYNNLKRHRYTHTGEKPYSCPHCPKSFTQTGHLKKHVESMHKK